MEEDDGFQLIKINQEQQLKRNYEMIVKYLERDVYYAIKCFFHKKGKHLSMLEHDNIYRKT